jgi:class 3 adenylate cyclase/tetratricopeptide (TPR) repeat protein
MTCPSCGAENREGRKFCAECGGPLSAACPSCGASNEPGERFCGECGAALADAPSPAAAPSPAPEPAAERRLVSILFADLVGFTSLSEGRDSEEVRELQTRYFDTCRRLVTLYGGTIEKFIGDAVMAVWGTPTATEDDAERAVRASLDLVAAVSALGDEVGLPELRARAAVMTGEAAVTIGAEGQGMVSGDLVNTASRVQALAEPGQVLVGEVTRRSTEPTVVYESAGAHELKGKDGLVPLWRALRVVSGARGSLKSQGLEAPFVGRDRELRLVKDLFHGCFEERRAHLISVVGIAGIGKSRLSWEIFKYFDGLPQITLYHRGRCLSYGEGVTYWALADMVRMRARVAEEEQPATALPKLREVVAEFVPDEDERRFVEPRLAHLIGLEESSGYERDDLFAAWRLFFERLADVDPVYMVFEDMQWADDSLLDFIDYLLEWSRNLPICVITLARPDLLERRPNWGAGRRNFTSIYLEPLPERAMEELLAGLVPGLPEEARTQILARAEGIPLYAVETVRMLLDRGALVQEGSVYRPTGPIDTLDVPETLQALIAARLDGLPQEERRLLQDAAVLGKTFTKRALAALSSLPESELDPLLTSLLRKEVLTVQADPRSPEHGQYGFLQDLVRHVAYETLSKRERRTRHLAAAAHLQASFPEEEEVVEVVASHYLDAYNAAPDADDADEIKAKARQMLARAGERAASLGAGREAQRYFEQAAELTDDQLARAELDDRAARMAWRRGRGPEARELFGKALAIYEAEGLTRPAARIASVLAEIDFRDGRHLTEAVGRLEHALESLDNEEPDADLAAVAAQLGRFLVLDGQFEAAAPRLELALELAEALKLQEVFAQALTTKAVILTRGNRLAEARLLLEGALAIGLEDDIPSVMIRASNNLGVVFESADRYEDSVSVTDRAEAIARRMGDRVWEAQLSGGSISGLVLLGRWEEAFAREEELAQSGVAHSIENLLLHLVEVECWRGRLEEARARLERAAELKESESTESMTAYRLHEAHILRTEGKPEAALAALDAVLEARSELGITFLTVKLGFAEALEAAFALGDAPKVDELLGIIEALRPGERPPILEAHAYRFRARQSGEEAGFATAASHFRELEMPFWLALTQLEHAEWLIGEGRTEEAEPLLAEARETFERLEARPYLERVDATQQEQVPA